MKNKAKPGSSVPDTAAPSLTLDQAEIDRFGALAAQWWDSQGKFRPLHQIGPARLTFIRDEIASHFAGGNQGGNQGGSQDKALGGAHRSMRPLRDLRILDIGCGGGLIAEPLARLGAAVTGIDPASDSIEAARRHGEAQGLKIDYMACRAEDLVAEGQMFDAVLCLEVVEHVPDVGAFMGLIAPLLRPGGIMILSTINRTIKAYGLAIVGAEYVLRWLPVGTHQWERFVTPDELTGYLVSAGLKMRRAKGLVYNPLTDRWSLSSDLDVNYMLSAAWR